MFRSVVLALGVCVGVCPGAFALSGSGDSAVGALETVPPSLDSIAVPSEASVEAAFSEPMLAPGTPGNYAVSGTGAGTLGVNPDSVSGSGPYTLTWSTGEMLDGAAVTLTVTSVQDAVGNPIDTNANSASATGVGVAPVFTGLTVMPPEAAAGVTVSISFDASEDLDTAPDVTVNGVPATLVSSGKATSFTYAYTVSEMDPLGATPVNISGFDPAGNLGLATGSFTITEAADELPVTAWPAALALLLAGLAVVAPRRRKWANNGGAKRIWFFLLAALLTAPAAIAQGPAVSNVAFTQQASTAGTEVVITYDLDSPNGPADITVTLSKDGGLDGFPFPVTSVTGALTGVTTGTGHTIIWDIAADYPDEDIPNAQLRVTAEDGFLVPPVEMVSVPAGSFSMGRTNAGDDATFGNSDELPVHSVTLSAYEIGKFEVTNQQVCDVYNWADDQGFFTTVNANTAAAFGQELLDLDSSASHIEYVGGVFQPETRTGLPGTTSYSMAEHPVVEISWFGAVVFCNWLSQMEGLTPVYNTSTWAANFANDGYHLPTEAQWERAAAWESSGTGKHWIYSFTSDTLTGKDRANYFDGNPDRVNSLGLTSFPNTSPVGWFDGVNVSPNGSIATVDSVSPIGAYNMSGNVSEWCHDWYDSGYYAISPGTDPEGPASGSARVVRGGSWFGIAWICRSANRNIIAPTFTSDGIGFRLARTVEYRLSYTAGAGGSLTGDTNQTVLPGGDGTPVEAVPDAGYAFVNWSDGSTDNPRTDTNVAKGISVTAAFAPDVEMVSVPAGSFDMGRTNAGDDATFGNSLELPVHTVMLSAYEIGKFEVTNQQVCDVYNWADDQGFFTTVNANTATAFGQELLDLDDSDNHIEYVGGVFQPETRTGDPGGSTIYSMADHPVQEISWFGAVAFCNWLSQSKGLTPVYNTSTWAADFANNGYHLPTEAQWERAAAWESSGTGKHWIYSFTSDTLTGRDRANYFDGSSRVNPLGLTSTPQTSPVGWFDGVNVSPNGSIATVDSASPVGAYDMSGNVWEWCHDWYDFAYYASSPGTDPEGPASGSSRVFRGGAWDSFGYNCRSADRDNSSPSASLDTLGFRLARTVEYSLSYTAGAGGALAGDTAQVVLPGEDGTPVEAVPDAGYAFVDWSDGVTDNPRTDTNVSRGVTVTANFSSLPVEMISVPAGSFDMGRTSSGDDASFGNSDELPVHTVTLSAYEIGTFEVTNQQVCDVFNWADDQGLFTTVDANTATAFGEELLNLDSSSSHIEYVGGVFQPETRTGLPGTTSYSMAGHPVQGISWFGAVAFCNWLSQIEGLTPVYNTSTWAANFANDGYHLPTEAQWERAAAWDGSKHWIYSFTSDTLTGRDRATYNDGSSRVNPLGLTSFPETSPVGWFDGSNVSPNGSIATVDSVSPIGAYDMSGNVWEWCHDWYDSAYYATGAAAGPDPEGPASGPARIIRGGNWFDMAEVCRSADRFGYTPSSVFNNVGFRLAR